MELERKKSRISKQIHKGPIIRYHSLTMPLIEELPPEPEISVDEDNRYEITLFLNHRMERDLSCGFLGLFFGVGGGGGGCWPTKTKNFIVERVISLGMESV